MPFCSLRLVLLLSAFALLPAASMAQSITDAPAPTPSAALSNSPLANSTLDVPIEDIAASPNGCAVLDKDFPGLRKHAMYGFFKTMTLRQIAALSHGRMTPDMLAQARTDLSPLSLVAAQPAHQPDIDDFDTAPRNNQVSLGNGRAK